MAAMASNYPTRLAVNSALRRHVAPSSAEISPPPAKRIGRDLRKAPSDQIPVRSSPELNDIVALLAADHLEEILSDRVGPLDLPCIDPGIVDPQRRAVGI